MITAKHVAWPSCARVLLSIFPFPLGHPEHEHCTDVQNPNITWSIFLVPKAVTAPYCKFREIRLYITFKLWAARRFASRCQCVSEGHCLNMSSAPPFPNLNQMLEDAISVIGGDGVPAPAPCEASLLRCGPTGFDPEIHL